MATGKRIRVSPLSFFKAIHRLASWIARNVDTILKLAAAFAAIFAALIAKSYESKMSAITLITQREQAESELRADMFTSLISPIVGPAEKVDEIEAEHLELLVELLALNFHEHFEFKPLLQYVDQRLADKDNEIGRESMRSIARRVTERQITMLMREGASEPLQIELTVMKSSGDYTHVTGTDFQSAPHLIGKLIKEKIIKQSNEGKDAAHTYYTFQKDINTEGDLNKILMEKGFDSEGKRKIIINAWRKTRAQVQQMPEDITVPLILKNGISQDLSVSVPCEDEHILDLIIPPRCGNEHVLSLTILDPNWEDQTVLVSSAIQAGSNESQNVVPQKFTLTWFDFPLTDNTTLADGNRFSLVMKLMDKDQGRIILSLIWFPKDYFTARERPIDYKEFRKKLGVAVR